MTAQTVDPTFTHWCEGDGGLDCRDYEQDGRLFVYDGGGIMYQVNYCPFCGLSASNQLSVTRSFPCGLNYQNTSDAICV